MRIRERYTCPECSKEFHKVEDWHEYVEECIDQRDMKCYCGLSEQEGCTCNPADWTNP